MIYLVSEQESLFEEDVPYKRFTKEDALDLIMSWDVVQYDSETNGRNPHLCKLLCAQFGNKKADTQIVVDTVTVDICFFKEVFVTKLIITQNGKFDYQFLFNYGIVPTNNWDTMIVEQALHLGYDPKYFHVSLKAICERRLGIDIDKTVRGEIIWRGLDPKVVIYAAGDVTYLEDIKAQQEEEVAAAHMKKAIQIENAFVTWIAYLEWCGIKLDVNKWTLKMQENERLKEESLKKLNAWVVEKAQNDSRFKKFTDDDPSDLFHDQFEEQCTINWNSDQQLKEFFRMLGFNLRSEDKKTGEAKDSVSDKVLKKQKGIADDLLSLYLSYVEKAKDCSTYGQNYIDAINPITGRIHTNFKQLGCDSGRMSCGGGNKDLDYDLAKAKHISPTRCVKVQLQNLPADEITRSSFICEDGNILNSTDFKALESRLGADIYEEPEMLEEFLHRSGDMHSLCAKLVFKKELEDVPIEKVEAVRPDLRKKVKSIEFSQQFGGGAKAVANSLGCSIKEASSFVQAYKEGFKGIAKFKEKGSAFVRANGYIIISKHTGLRLYWEDWKKWREIEDMPENLRNYEYTKDEIREHDMAAAKFDRLSLNTPTQGKLKCPV